MKKNPRPIWIGVMTIIFLSSACGALAQSSATPVGTVLPAGQTQTPEPTLTAAISITTTDTPVTRVIPITGENVVEMQCQFCVNSSPHAVFIFPDFAIFDVETTTPVTCLTAEVVNGQRVLVCQGTQLTSFNLKICSDASNCLLFPVSLQACPLAATIGTPIVTGTPLTPVFLTPINTLRSPTRTRVPGVFTPTSPATTEQPPTTTEAPPSPTSYP